jgi:hypothetical protein
MRFCDLTFFKSRTLVKQFIRWAGFVCPARATDLTNKSCPPYKNFVLHRYKNYALAINVGYLTLMVWVDYLTGEAYSPDTDLAFTAAASVASTTPDRSTS